MLVKELSDSGAIILGGTAGVGLETACQFAEQGASVVILGRNSARGQAATEAVRERTGSAAHFVQVDATDPASAVRAEAESRQILGSIDVMVSTTGPSEPPRLMHTMPIENIKPRIEEVVLPPLHMMHATLPAMREQGGGAIVVVASDAARVATPGETAIGAAMGAIVMYSKAAALEAKREGVRINLLTPSLIANTPGAALIDGEPFSAKMFEKASSMAHLGVPEPADLAAMAVFLAGPAGARITGQTISINGGISIA